MRMIERRYISGAHAGQTGQVIRSGRLFKHRQRGLGGLLLGVLLALPPPAADLLTVDQRGDREHSVVGRPVLPDDVVDHHGARVWPAAPGEWT